MKIIDVETDYSTGELKRTGNDLDLAINGKGFFHVQGDDGKQYLIAGRRLSSWIRKADW